MEHGPAYACTDESGCINRLTQVECLRDVCRCGEHCANQRFQRHAYAHVDIIKTPEKGFGIRACSDIERDEFVFEYIGEIITHDTFMRRMAQYKEEHLVHFYFMMLHLDEHLLDVHVVRHGDACEQQLNHPAIGGGISHGRHHTRTFWLSNRMQYGMKVFIQDLGPLLLLMPPTGQRCTQFGHLIGNVESKNESVVHRHDVRLCPSTNRADAVRFATVARLRIVAVPIGIVVE